MKKWIKKHKYGMILVSIILVMTYFTIFGERGILHLQKMERNLEAMKKEIKRISVRNERLKQKIQFLQSDEHYIEEIARKELGMVRKDEIIYKKLKP